LGHPTRLLDFENSIQRGSFRPIIKKISNKLVAYLLITGNDNRVKTQYEQTLVGTQFGRYKPPVLLLIASKSQIKSSLVFKIET
jgi:hypothetical protein